MGKKSKTEEDIRADATLDSDTDESFAHLARATGLKFPQDGIANLKAALRRFEQNCARWTDPAFGSREMDPVLWKHSLFTLWVPGGKASKVRTAIDALDGDGWFDELSDNWDYELLVERISPYVRFPRQKAKRTRDAMACLRIMFENNTVPHSVLKKHTNTVKCVPGMGNKAAAHFMRNTGLSHGWEAIPIIDTHILKFLHNAKGAQTIQPGQYRSACTLFTAAARKYNIPPLLLDAALWCAYANNWDITHSDFDNFEKQGNDDVK